VTSLMNCAGRERHGNSGPIIAGFGAVCLDHAPAEACFGVHDRRGETALAGALMRACPERAKRLSRSRCGPTDVRHTDADRAGRALVSPLLPMRGDCERFPLLAQY
jgi:hypothetical protein